jgi:glycosyltransferase involved in cell wall biosynthesis
VGLSAAAVADLNRNRRLAAVSEATRTFHHEQGIGRRTADARSETSSVAAPAIGEGDRRPAVDVLYNGVDLDHFRPRPSTGVLRRSLGLPDDAFLIATVGQVALRKGHDVLASAAALTANRSPWLHYLLIGERHSSKDESIAFDRAITETFAAAGIANRLHRLGVRDDVAALMNEVDLLAHPARQEPLGRVLLEAAASGTPIVATRVGGTAEIVRDGISARLVSPDDPEALAAAMTALADDRDLRARLASAARREVEERFDIQTRGPALAKFLLESVASPNSTVAAGRPQREGPVQR